MTITTNPTGAIDPALGLGRPEVATSIEEHAQAQQLLAALEEKVRDGDPGVKPAELRDAREVVNFARLRVQAAQRAAERREREERAAAYAELGARAHGADIVPDAQLVQAFTDALATLDRLAALAVERSTAIQSIAAGAMQLLQVADQHGERDVLRAAGIHNAQQGGLGGPQVILVPADAPPYTLTDVAPQDLLMAVLGRVQARATQTLGDSEHGPSAALAEAARVFPDLATAAPHHEQDQAGR